MPIDPGPGPDADADADPGRRPLAAGGVSLRLYPHLELPVVAAVDELIGQGVAAVAAGFDGLMTSEHHNGFGGYLPNPLQAAGWLLDATERGWATPCPLLLPLRPPALVVEETAWLAARHPGRVGLGVAAGSLEADFTALGLTKDGLTDRFTTGLALVADALLGRDPGPLAGDPAVVRCRTHPVPVVSAATSLTAARRAGRLGVGILLDSLATPERCRRLGRAQRDAGGRGPVVLVRRVWLGHPPAERQARQLDVYRSYAAPAAQAHWSADGLLAADDPADLAERLAAVADDAGADALNLRVHVPGLDPAEVREQIAALGPVAAAVSARLRTRGGRR